MSSHPARGAWIEITCAFRSRDIVWSHPARGAWIEIEAGRWSAPRRSSHPARGAWIEIRSNAASRYVARGRTPQGVRGLKFEHSPRVVVQTAGRTPQGVRGLKYLLRRVGAIISCRTPQGVRGLKYTLWWCTTETIMSHPARGAWIEICADHQTEPFGRGRTPQGVRGLKLCR